VVPPEGALADGVAAGLVGAGVGVVGAGFGDVDGAGVGEQEADGAALLWTAGLALRGCAGRWPEAVTPDDRAEQPPLLPGAGCL
jgi:hypothetical protein